MSRRCSRRGSWRGHAEDLVVAAGLVGHPEHADRAALDEAAGERRLLQDHERVERVAVLAEGVLDEAVVGRVGGRGEEHAVQADAAGLVVDLVLVALTLGDLHQHVELSTSSSTLSGTPSGRLDSRISRVRRGARRVVLGAVSRTMAPMREARGSKRRGREVRHLVTRWLPVVLVLALLGAGRRRLPLRVGPALPPLARRRPGDRARGRAAPGRARPAGVGRRGGRRRARGRVGRHRARQGGRRGHPRPDRPRPRPARGRRGELADARLARVDDRRRALPARLDHQAADPRRRPGDARPRPDLHHEGRARRRTPRGGAGRRGRPAPGEPAGRPRGGRVDVPRPRRRDHAGPHRGGGARRPGTRTGPLRRQPLHRPDRQPGLAPRLRPRRHRQPDHRAHGRQRDRARPAVPVRRPVPGRRSAPSPPPSPPPACAWSATRSGSSYAPGPRSWPASRARRCRRSPSASSTSATTRAPRSSPTRSASPSSGDGLVRGRRGRGARHPGRARHRRVRRRGVRRLRPVAPQPGRHHHAAGPDPARRRTGRRGAAQPRHRPAGRRVHRLADLPLRRGPGRRARAGARQDRHPHRRARPRRDRRRPRRRADGVRVRRRQVAAR